MQRNTAMFSRVPYPVLQLASVKGLGQTISFIQDPRVSSSSNYIIDDE